jgi:hypothetical protein
MKVGRHSCRATQHARRRNDGTTARQAHQVFCSWIPTYGHKCGGPALTQESTTAESCCNAETIDPMVKLIGPGEAWPT